MVKLTLAKHGLQLNQLFYLFQGVYKKSDIFSTSARCKTQQPAWEVGFLFCKIVSATCCRCLEAERGFLFYSKVWKLFTTKKTHQKTPKTNKKNPKQPEKKKKVQSFSILVRNS